MGDRWFSTRSHLGFLLRVWFRRQAKPQPSPADISSVRVALVMAAAAGEAMAEASRTAVRDLKEAGIVDSELDATLRSTWGVTEMIGHSADREMKRLGIR